MIFYLFSFLSGFFEIGPMIMILSREGVAPLGDAAWKTTGAWDVVHGPVIPLALGAALCYQLGNLVPSPFKLSRPAAAAGAGLAAAGFAFFTFRGPGSGWILLPAVFFCSAAIQAIRGELKVRAPQTRKRLVRILGFGSGFFCSPSLAAAGIVILFAAMVWNSRCRCGENRSEPFSVGKGLVKFSSFRFGLLDWAMVFHQMHFFTYCYVIIIAAWYIGGTGMAVLVFLPGWFSYTLSESIYRKIAERTLAKGGREEPGDRGGRKNYFPWQRFFIFGHSLLVVVLLGLYLIPSLGLRFLLWVLTGLGGTTVFCIKNLKDDWRREPAATGNGESLAVSENTGHVLGTLCCIFVCVTGGRLSYVFPLSAVFVGITITIMLVSVSRHTNTVRRKG